MLNPSERVIENIQTAPTRMKRVDEILGEQRLLYFAQGLARLLAHMESLSGSLCEVVESRDIRTDIVIQIINAATELETGWNAIRLANIPASQRQGRVAFELIAVTVLAALPLPTLRNLPREVPLARCLQDNPDKTVIDCYRPTPKDTGNTPVAEPLLQATQFFSSFLDVAERLLGIPKQLVDEIRSYRKQVQHPASHGTAELSSYHFEAFQGEAAGAVFDKRRSESYIFAADELGKLAHLLADILDHVTRYLLKSKGVATYR